MYLQTREGGESVGKKTHRCGSLSYKTVRRAFFFLFFFLSISLDDNNDVDDDESDNLESIFVEQRRPDTTS